MAYAPERPPQGTPGHPSAHATTGYTAVPERAASGLDRPDAARYATATTSDPLVVVGDQVFRQIEGVEEITHERQEDVMVFVIQGSHLSLETVSAIVDAKWRLIDRFPGRYLEVEIQDRFGS